MYIRFTFDDFVTRVANCYAKEKQEIGELTVEKYNILVVTFNFTTIALVSAVVLSFLASVPAAVVLGVTAFFTRAQAKKALDEYPNSLFFRNIETAEGRRWSKDAVDLCDIILWKNRIPGA